MLHEDQHGYQLKHRRLHQKSALPSSFLNTLLDMLQIETVALKSVDMAVVTTLEILPVSILKTTLHLAFKNSQK